MSDLAVENDGGVAAAGEAINALLFSSEPEALASAEVPVNAAGRPYDPATGKFLPTKPKEEDDGVIPIDDPDAPAPEADEEPEAEGEQEEPESDEPAPKASEPIKVKVKVDGIEQELPLDEVTKGYSRTADYTRKTQALAEEKRKFEQEELAPVREERKVYAERLDALHQAIQALLPETEPDWNEVRTRTTPEEFTQAFAEWQSQQQRLGKIKAEQERMRSLAESDHQRWMQAKLAEEHEKLKAALPEFADAEKGKALKDDLIAYLKSDRYHFTDDDLGGVTDHRLLVMADKARRWDEAQLRKPKIDAKIDRALDTIRPSTTKSKPKTSEIEQAKARLKASGRVEDAAAALNLMGIK
jgi:hypothetical protein